MGKGWIFGIDGGGTSARLRIEEADRGAEGGAEGRKDGAGRGRHDRPPLFYGEGGSSNPRSNPREAVLAVLRGLFARAYREAGLRAEGCLGGFAGSAGVDREADREPFAALVREAAGLPPGVPVLAGNDSEPALAGAIGDVEGLLLIAGTGSIAFGRARDGSSARAGGWGHLLGDEGSAFSLAFKALSRGLRSWEGRDLPTGLMDAGLEFFGLAGPPDLVPLVYEGLDKTRIARFARVVGEYRDRGDPLAFELFEEAERELAALVVSVDARVGPKLERKRLAFRGGLIEGDARLRAGVESRLAAALPGLEIVPAAADAAAGACILARDLANHGRR